MAPRVDWHTFEKARFATDVAAVLDRTAVADAFAELVIVAPPETLGNLRTALGKAARAKVVEEIGKDLTHLTVKEVSEYLVEAGDRAALRAR